LFGIFVASGADFILRLAVFEFDMGVNQRVQLLISGPQRSIISSPYSGPLCFRRSNLVEITKILKREFL